MASLLYDAFEHSSIPLVKQQIAILLIISRPPKWYSYIEKYIIDLPKDSFFLFEILNEMRAQYRFGFLDDSDLRAFPILIKKCLAKHDYGVKTPDPGLINKIPSSILPKRENGETSKV